MVGMGMGAANAVTVDTPDPGNLGIDAALKAKRIDKEDQLTYLPKSTKQKH